MNIGSLVPLAAIIIGAIFAILIIVRFAMFLSDFQGELKYINNEIKRTSGREKKRWERRRRRLWLSLIPFVKY